MPLAIACALSAFWAGRPGIDLGRGPLTPQVLGHARCRKNGLHYLFAPATVLMGVLQIAGRRDEAREADELVFAIGHHGS